MEKCKLRLFAIVVQRRFPTSPACELGVLAVLQAALGVGLYLKLPYSGIICPGDAERMPRLELEERGRESAIQEPP